jgi:AcrR family transcriptional regulator
MSLRRRDRQREETRRDLALAAYELASTGGLANLRVPDIAAAAGVSTRTFNNYFSSKEAAIAWPATRRGGRMATNLLERPDDEPLGDALVAAVSDLYGPGQDDGLPPGWLAGFRTLVATEPSLHGEYLKASDAAERALARAIAERVGDGDGLWTRVLAAMAVGAERAAVRYWLQQDRQGSLVGMVRTAVKQAVAGIEHLT